MASPMEASLALLASEKVFPIPDRMSRRKWDGPWWHMATLCEMGESRRIPRSAAEGALELLKHGAWPRFVLTEEEAPRSEADRAKMDCCHCELGVFYMILSACGFEVDVELPWIRAWFLEHQLPDGGLNCEPSAYGGSRKSSVVSTLPPLESVLFFTRREYTAAEAEFLDEGARYLIEHRLVCSKKDGTVINEEWLKPVFPRFFEYDILRGMYFLGEWSRRRRKGLPGDLIEEGLHRIGGYTGESGVVIGRHVNDESGGWNGRSFPLLQSVSEVGKESPYLTRQLNAVVAAVQTG